MGQPEEEDNKVGVIGISRCVPFVRESINSTFLGLPRSRRRSLGVREGRGRARMSAVDAYYASARFLSLCSFLYLIDRLFPSCFDISTATICVVACIVPPFLR